MFTMLSVAQIRAWVRSLVVPGAPQRLREGVTASAIAQYTGIPRNTLTWLANSDTARLSLERQRLLSKVIAQVENGLLDFEIRGNRKVAVLRDKPKVVQRYGVSMVAGQARLTYIDRPPAPKGMPTLKSMMTRR